MSIRTIAIYTEPDAASTHVSEADVAVLLPGSPAKAYIDGYDILCSYITILSFCAKSIMLGILLSELSSDIQFSTSHNLFSLCLAKVSDLLSSAGFGALTQREVSRCCFRFHHVTRDEIIKIAKEHKADAIIPGYGFLSENADFARAVAAAGMAWVGPSTESIEAFGIKHTARDLAKKAGVPIVPGTQGLIANEEEAVKESEILGFPVMLKATAGGGGMGLAIAHNTDDVKKSFAMVKSRGENLFKNSGMFIERYYPDSHHIEVQVFGNGLGNAIHFGERECSIQRRHQKVIEECPSPFVVKHPGEHPIQRSKTTTNLPHRP